MAFETQWRLQADDSILVEPYELVDEGGYVSYIIKNIGDEDGLTLGFHLTAASTITLEQTEMTPEEQLAFILAEGALARGITIKQDVVETTFVSGVGDTEANKIPLLIGPTDADTLYINEEIVVQVKIDLEPSVAQNIYIDIVLI